MTSNEYALDVLTFSESQSNQNSRPLFKRTTLNKSDDPNQEIPSESLQTIPLAQVEEVLTYSNFPFSNKSQLSIQGTQEDLDKLFALDKSNVPKTIQIYGESQISQGSLNLNKDPNTLPNDGENVYGRNNRAQGNGRKSYTQSLDISNIEEKSGIIVESFGDKISQDASDMKIILASNKDTPGPASPVRYGKMSEEAAAIAYEARRKELLESLAKVTDKKPKKSSTPNNISRKNASSDARRSPDQKSPIGNKTFTNFEQKIGSVRKAALSKDFNVPPSPHFGRAGPEGSKPKVHQARTREDVAHLISWTPKSTQQSNRRSNSKNSNRSFSNLSSSFRDPEERAAVLTKLLAKDQPAQKEKHLNNAQQAALKGFTFGKDHHSSGKDLYTKLTTGNEESTVAEEQRDNSPKPIPQQAYSVEVESQEIEGDEQEQEEQERERERNVFAGSTYQSVYFSSRMKSQGKDVMEDLDALDKEISKLETENREEEARNSVQKRPVQSKNIARPQSASLNKNKWSLVNSPIKISENGAEVPSASKKRLTPIREVRNNNVRGQRVSSKESERTAPEQQEEEVVQYETLNERGYQGHYEYLHARAMIQKKNKDIVYKKNQQKKAAEEVEECTFTPKTISSPSKREDIISKTKKWEAEREDKLVRNEMAIIEKEMSACTFYPNNMLQTAGPGSHTFSNFFQRNTEWRKNKETKNKLREEKVYSSIMTSPKTQNTRETFRTLSNSKDEGTPVNYTLPIRSTYLGSPNNNNKPLKTCCEEKLTTLSAFKKDGHKPNVEGISSPSRRQSGKQKPASAVKKPVTSPKKKEIDGSELKHDIAQSYQLLQQLKDTVKDTTSTKNKFTKKPLTKQQPQKQQTQPSQQQQHEVDGYDDFDFRLKTTGASFLRDNEGFTEHSQRAISRNSQKFSIGSSPQPRLSAPRKVPLNSVEFDPSVFQPGEYMITQQNNRYYIQGKREKKEKNPSSKVFRTSSSEQNLHSASPINCRPSALSPNHSILSNRNSYRDTSAKKNKNVTINTDLNLEYYDNGDLTEVRKATTTNSVANGKKSSDFLKLHYVTNGIVELPQTASLDKKYSELVKKVHDVSGKLKTLGKGVYMSQI